MLDNLIPVSQENSLRQVTASVFTLNPLIEPKRYEKYLSDLNYQKFELIRKRTINLSLNKIDESKFDFTPKESGFRITNFKEGRINNQIIVEQRKNNDRELTVFEYHSLKYPKWENFKKSFLNDFEIISKEDNPFITAISLTYTNEFIWNSNEDILIDEIFDKSAEFMPKFFNSQNSSFLINTENDKQDYKLIETLEVGVSKRNKRILTNSQVVFELKKQTKFNDSILNLSIGAYFEEIHNELKITLRKLFTNEVKQKINLQ